MHPKLSRTAIGVPTEKNALSTESALVQLAFGEGKSLDRAIKILWFFDL